MNNIAISMTQSGDPLENAIAERVNGILKQEYLDHYSPTSMVMAKEILQASVELYNRDRPHMSLNNQTPFSVHYNNNATIPVRLWKNYYRKSTETDANVIQD